MLRATLSFIAGFVAMVAVSMLIIPVAMALGPDRCFQPGTYQSAPLLILIDLSFGVLAALVGGAVCGWIARSMRPVVVLVCVVVVLGIVTAAMEIKKPDPGPRTGPVTIRQCMENGRAPVWYFWVLPFLGAPVMFAAGKLARRKPATSAA